MPGVILIWMCWICIVLIRWLRRRPRFPRCQHQSRAGRQSDSYRDHVAPPVAAGGQELRCGVLDYRMVATMIARTENVDDEVIGQPR